MKTKKRFKEYIHKLKIMGCLFLIVSLIMQFCFNDYLLAYGSDNVIEIYNIGVDNDNVIAILTTDGTIKISGMGETKDYTAETMPFIDNIDKITSIHIEEGVTSIGSYLFFGCKNLNDTLVLPKTITRIGDYAFNGYSKETAPTFTYITNDFKSADIIVPVEATKSTESSVEDMSAVDQTDTQKNIETGNTIPSNNGDSKTASNISDDSNISGNEKTESSKTIEDSSVSETNQPDEDTKSISDSKTSQASSQEMEIKTITEQDIGSHIFCLGQTGGYQAQSTNKSFKTEVEAAGYIEADRFVTVKLDGVITQHLPVKNGKMIIPALPNFGIVSDEADTAYVTHLFAGWRINDKICQPNDEYDIASSVDEVALTSSWNEQWSIDPQIKSEAKEDVTVYTVIDKNTQNILEQAEGYQIFIKWQINKGNQEDEAAWEDIDGATSLSYERKVESGDTQSYFRANINIVESTNLRTTSSTAKFTTEAVSGINSLTPITVMYSAGDGAAGIMEQEVYSEYESFAPSANGFTAPSEKVFAGWKVTNIDGVVAMYPSGEKTIKTGDIIKPDTVNFTVKLDGSTTNGSISLEAQWSAYTIVYVDQSNGNDANGGTESYPVKSLSAAYKLLPENGELETNLILLKTNYTCSNTNLENTIGVNATISGQKDKNIIFNTGTSLFNLTGDLKLENMTIKESASQLAFAQYAHTLIIGEGVSATSKDTLDVTMGVPNGTPNIQIWVTFNEGLDATAKKFYGTAGKSEDNPIISQVDSATFKLGRWGALGRNATDSIYGTSPTNTTSVTLNLNNGWVGLLCAGGISDREEYGNIEVNINNGYVYNLAGSNNPYANKSTLNGNIKFNINGGEVNTINCGPMGRNASNITHTNADIELAITDGQINTIYCGGSTGTLIGDVNVFISGGTIGTLFGGGSGYSEFVPSNKYYDNAAVVTGNISMIFTGGTVNNNLYVGGKGYEKSKNSGTVNGNTYLSISGNTTINGNIFCGGIGLSSDSSAAQITGNSKVEINGGIITGNIYGGGELGQIGVASTLIISQGDIKGDVFGGGNNVGVPTSNITIKGSPSINGNIYGGSNATGTTATSNLNIEGIILNNVYAGGKGSGTTVTDATLNINDGADIKGNAYGGSEQGTVTNSKVQLNGGYVESVFGGSDQANVTGSVSIISLAGSKAGNIYAGCNASGTVKNPTLSLAGAAINVFGGGNATNTEIDDVDGTATVNIYSNEANIITNIFGGANTTGMVTSSIVNISGYVENVYGGGLGADTITNAPTVNILAGANVTGNVYGGGEEGITHGTTVNIQSGSVNNAFAGGHKAGVDNTVRISAQTGSKTVNLYGGANESGTVSSPVITLSGEVENAFGGGYGNETTTISPIVNIESDAVITDSAFGGGNLGEVSNPTGNIYGGSAEKVFAGGNKVGVTGKVILNTSNTDSGIIQNIYGGSNSSGTVDSPVLNIAGKAVNIYGGGYGGAANDGSGTVTSNPVINVTDGTISNIYGGGEMGPTSGINKIDITGGTITNVYGGGKSIGAKETDITVSGDTASVSNVFGGSSLKGDVTQSNIKINGKVESIYGGGEGAATKVITTYVITGTGSKAKDIYGGSKEGTVTNATLVIHDSVTGSIYGGGYGATSVVKEDTWVYTANDVAGNIYGGGNQGSVNGNTHVDVAAGKIGTEGDDATGNVFGGSNQAKVYGNTKVHIGSYVVITPQGATLPTGADKSVNILGTVFGGGNTTLGGKDFDASDPYVLGDAVVEIGGTDYTLTIGKSIFGDGNKCVTNGNKTIQIEDYKAVGDKANKSIQRASELTIINSEIELVGEKDTANLVTTIDYSLNRIDNLILKGGTNLKLQSTVNLVMGFESQNGDGTHQTKSQANNDITGNKLYIQQGKNVDFRINEDVSRPGYGEVKGFTQLGRYYINGNPIDAGAQGIYVMGSFYSNDSDNTKSGFIVAETEKLENQTELIKGDLIEPTTNSTSWRNWLVGSTVKTKDANMTISDEPGSGKTTMIEGWAADGSIYRINPDSLTLTGNSKYIIVNPDDIDEMSENKIGLSIETGQTGWLEQLKAGYVDTTETSPTIKPYTTGKADTVAANDSLDMRSIINSSQNPIINVKLFNADNITTTDANPLVVYFEIDRISQQPDGSEIKTGTIFVTLTIKQENKTNFSNVLISQGKEYDRGAQLYLYDNMSDNSKDVGTSVSQSSSITAQFAEKLVSPQAVTKNELTFTKGKISSVIAMPKDTKILMVDRSSSTPVYYNYTLLSEESTISLTSFVKNGTNEHYVLPIDMKKANLLFILDFEEAPDFKNSDICMTLNTTYGNSMSSQKKVRFAITGEKRTYEMTSLQDNENEPSVPTYRMNETFGLSLKTALTNSNTAGTDTTGSDLQMAARVQLKLTNTDTGTVLPIPKGWLIQSNGTRYSTRGDSATIILSNSLTETSSDIYVIMSYMGDLPAGNYKLEMSLVSGPMANYPSATLNADTVIYKFKLVDDRYSMTATMQDMSKQVIEKDSINPMLQYDLIRINNGSSVGSNIKTKISLYKKEEDTDTMKEVILTDYILKITDVTTGKEITDQLIPWSTYKTIAFTLKDNIASGTYQIRYEIIQTTTGSRETTAAAEISPFIVTKD